MQNGENSGNNGNILAERESYPLYSPGVSNNGEINDEKVQHQLRDGNNQHLSTFSDLGGWGWEDGHCLRRGFFLDRVIILVKNCQTPL